MKTNNVRRLQLCGWVTRVHNQADVNLLRDAGQYNVVRPFFKNPAAGKGHLGDRVALEPPNKGVVWAFG